MLKLYNLILDVTFLVSHTDSAILLYYLCDNIVVMEQIYCCENYPLNIEYICE